LSLKSKTINDISVDVGSVIKTEVNERFNESILFLKCLKE